MALEDPKLTSEGRLLPGLLVAFVAIVAVAGFDLASDLDSGSSFRHVAVEGGLILLGLIGAIAVGQRMLAQAKDALRLTAEAEELSERLSASTAEAAHWRKEARDLMAGLSQAIDHQFDRWELSPAEKEVGLLLLKGLSHKEVAAVRNVTEATARQQARAIYRKSNLSGRHDLAAFFLEDLMLPSSDSSPDS